MVFFMSYMSRLCVYFVYTYQVSSQQNHETTWYWNYIAWHTDMMFVLYRWSMSLWVMYMYTAVFAIECEVFLCLPAGRLVCVTKCSNNAVHSFVLRADLYFLQRPLISQKYIHHIWSCCVFLLWCMRCLLCLYLSITLGFIYIFYCL
jgi:hypothetical protein